MTTANCPFCGALLINAQDGNSPVATCPSCGKPMGTVLHSSDPGPLGWIRRYFWNLWQIMTRPTVFFRRMPLKGGIAGPLAFAVVTSWIGAALEYLWKGAVGGTIGKYFNDWFQVAGDVAEVDSPGRKEAIFAAKDQFLHWFWGTGSVLLDPFLTLGSLLFTAVFVYAGARLLVTPGKSGAPREITFETALRILCFGMSPAILAGIPLVGGFVSQFFVTIVTIIGAREVYRVGSARATVIALFPKLLILGILLGGVLLLGFVAFRAFATIS